MDFPTTVGSVIRASPVGEPRPDIYMLGYTSGGAGPWWAPTECMDHGHTPEGLDLIDVIHDEGYAQLLHGLPDWDDLTDRDKGVALLHASKVDNEGAEYARENFPPKFRDHPTLLQLRPPDASDFVTGWLCLAVPMTSDIEGYELDGHDPVPWDEAERLRGCVE